jgi:hypothetical protein
MLRAAADEWDSSPNARDLRRRLLAILSDLD